MAGLDEDGAFAPRKPATTHEIGQPIDLLSARELAERIDMLKGEILRLEGAVKARQASLQAASSFFKA